MLRQSRLLLFSAGFGLVLFSLLRLLLIALNWSLIPHHVGSLLLVCLGGLRFDLAVIGVLGLPGALWVALSRDRMEWRDAGVFTAFLFIGWFVFLYLNIADAFFFAEFNAHFNYVAVDYIFVNGHEVLQNIWQSYRVIPISLLALIASAALTALVLFCSQTRSLDRRASGHRPGFFLIWLLITIGALASIPLRGSPSHDNRLMGELSTNGYFTLVYALVTNDLAYDDYYDTVDKAEALAQVRDDVLQSDQRFLNETSIRRRVPGTDSPNRMNVVIILEESFGSNFVDALYPRPDPITPESSRLTKEGLFFTHIYATGNRTVRALEGVLASFMPIPGASIVKRKPERPFTTIANVLKSDGYQTLFIYGGHGIFDNLYNFATRNGFDRFIEQNDFKNPVFTTAWGVSDEDIFKKANETFEAIDTSTAPFFSVILTISNHRPYVYPAGRIDLKPEEKKRDNAVNYADWALGQFFKEARQMEYFKKTLFVVLGDHGARVYGADFIPLASYEIPVLMLAPHAVEPQINTTLGGSIDIAPTILGLLGVPYDSPFFGRDLLRVKAGDGYAFMQHDRDLGFFEDNTLVVLSTPRRSSIFHYQPDSKSFQPIDHPNTLDRERLADAIAFYQTGYAMFVNALKEKKPD